MANPQLIDSPTEPRTREPQTTQHRTTKLQMTEPRKTEPKKRLNLERQCIKNYPRSNDNVSQTTQGRTTEPQVRHNLEYSLIIFMYINESNNKKIQI
jgi:hypothetical protein